MKIIVQWKPDEVEQQLYNISEEQMNKYEVDIDTYGYFLNNIFVDQFQSFVESKTGKTFDEIVGFVADPDDGPAKVEAMYEWQDKTLKYLKEFHEKRSKFYLYKGSIFSYTFMGWGNVGQVVEIIKYENEDLVQILNNYCNRGNSIIRKIFK